jgi:hypothetical protein
MQPPQQDQPNQPTHNQAIHSSLAGQTKPRQASQTINQKTALANFFDILQF